jgi:DNA-binding NarL/FixJ family response regulator
VFRALRAGASGFALKSRPLEDLLSAIRVVASGEALPVAPPPDHPRQRAGGLRPGRRRGGARDQARP